LQRRIGIISRHFEGAALLSLRCVYHSLRINKTGNNSGAFLLTIRSLTNWRGNAPFFGMAKAPFLGFKAAGRRHDVMAGLDPAIQKEQRVFGWLGHARR
jgi:hypothetical protein